MCISNAYYDAICFCMIMSYSVYVVFHLAYLVYVLCVFCMALASYWDTSLRRLSLCVVFFRWLSLTLLSRIAFFAAFIYVAVIVLTDVEPIQQIYRINHI